MPTDRPQERSEPDTKSGWIRDVYRRLLRAPDLTDKQIDQMREHVMRLARVLCEHVWGKRFY
jgi:hypothetical protein